ncbi:hypothetical protein BB561_002070 [Smittium simulii]|uniref:Uncharacterized protein n=1 Tax=Smittium simulii TaxID=133385 RepID=A0A2T9YS15_9FUNG|nr:hypothetical protein BB561_002070 [Smittium simulii]
MEQIQKLVARGNRAIVKNEPLLAWKAFNKALLSFNSYYHSTITSAYFNDDSSLFLANFKLYTSIWQLYISVLSCLVKTINSRAEFCLIDLPASSTKQNKDSNTISLIANTLPENEQAFVFPLNASQFLEAISSNYLPLFNDFNGIIVQLACLFLIDKDCVYKARAFAESWLANLSSHSISALENTKNSSRSEYINKELIQVFSAEKYIKADNLIRQSYIYVVDVYCFNILLAMNLFEQSNSFLSFNIFLSPEESAVMQKKLGKLNQQMHDIKQIIQQNNEQKKQALEMAELEIKEQENNAKKSAIEEPVLVADVPNKVMDTFASDLSTVTASDPRNTAKKARELKFGANTTLIKSEIINSKNLEKNHSSHLSKSRILVASKNAIYKFIKNYGLHLALIAIFVKLARFLIKKHGSQIILAKINKMFLVAANMATKITYL